MPLAPDRAVVIVARDAKLFLIGDRNMVATEPVCRHSSVKEHLEVRTPHTCVPAWGGGVNGVSTVFTDHWLLGWRAFL